MAEKTTELRGRAAVSSSDPDEIQAQIEQTRTQMGHTIDEIQQRLSPEYIKEQTQATIREATIGKVEKMANQVENKVNNWRTNTMATIRENPIPVALIGVGLGWLLFKGDQDNGEYYYGQRTSPYDSGYRYSYNPQESWSATHEGEDMMDRTRERVADVAGEAREWVEEKVDAVEDKVAEVTQQARQKKDEIAETFRERADTMAERTQQTAHHVEEGARRQMARARHTFWDTLDENPLALGMVAMAAGAIAGMVIPGTSVEDRYMGEMRDHFVEEARTTAQQTAHKVKAVAEQAQEAAVEEAKHEAERQDLIKPEPTTSSMGEPTMEPVIKR